MVAVMVAVFPTFFQFLFLQPRYPVLHLVVVAIWLSGDVLVVINEVILHWTRLVLGWVTVHGRVNHLSM